MTTSAERTGVFLNRAKQPDLIVRTTGGNTVVIESEFMPANAVEQDALGRLGEVFADTNEIVETVIALRVPATLREIEGRISNEIRSTEFECCCFRQLDLSTKR